MKAHVRSLLFDVLFVGNRHQPYISGTVCRSWHCSEDPIFSADLLSIISLEDTHFLFQHGCAVVHGSNHALCYPLVAAGVL